MTIEEKAFHYCVQKANETLVAYIEGKVPYEEVEDWCLRVAHQIKKLHSLYAIDLLGLAKA